MAKKRMEEELSEDLYLEVDDVEGEEGLVRERGVGILDHPTMTKLISYLDEELDLCEAERQDKSEQWKKWRRQREFRPEKKQLDYPWPKSANTTVPLAGMLTQNMYAYIQNTFDLRDPLISVRSVTKEPGDVEVAVTLEKYLDLLAESPFDMNLRKKIRTIAYEGSSMGTVFNKVPWTTDRWVFKTPDEFGEMQTIITVLHDGPEWIPTGREDFLYREYAQDVQKAPWVAHHFELGEHELHNRAADKIYEFVEKVKTHYRSEPLEHQRDQQERAGVVQQTGKVYDLYEVYVYWLLPDEDYMVDLLVTYNREAKVIMRAEYNELGIRPVGPANYIARPFYLDGMGIGWITEYMQDEVDYHHRLRINNSHFASMSMFAIKGGAGYGGKETIYPGKIWKVDDPSKDIARIPGGDVYPTSLQDEAMAVQYAERGVGFSDAQRGFADMVAKSGTSAQLQMFNAQQGGKLINSVIEGLVDDLSMFSMFTVFQLVKNRKRVIKNERENKRMTDEEIANLDKALDMPLQSIPKRLRFSIRTTDMDKTFEVRRQNTLTLVEIYGMFWEKTIPLLAMINDKRTPPEMKPVLSKAFTGSCNMLEKIFKFFGEDATQKFVPDYKRMEIMLEIRETLMGDLDEAKKALEEVRSGKGQGAFGARGAAAIGGAAGGLAAAEAGGGGQRSVSPAGMGVPQQGVQRPAGGAGPLA